MAARCVVALFTLPQLNAGPALCQRGPMFVSLPSALATRAPAGRARPPSATWFLIVASALALTSACQSETADPNTVPTDTVDVADVDDVVPVVPSEAVPAWPACEGEACCLARGLDCTKAPGFACVTSDGRAFCRHESSGEVLVPEGAFWRGCRGVVQVGGEDAPESCHVDELPAHLTVLGAFAIDETEVTAAQYRTCVEAGACSKPINTAGNLGTYDPLEKRQRPINFITPAQAEDWCRWDPKAPSQKRLCTEAEWEKAARGGCAALGCAEGDRACCERRSPPYPWGWSRDDATARAHIYGEGPTEVGSYPAGRSVYGALDLAGNVEEWVADDYASDVYCMGPAASCVEVCDRCSGQPAYAEPWTDPAPLDIGAPARVLRGGGFDVGMSVDSFPPEPNEDTVRVSVRNWGKNDAWGSRISVRCCRSLGP
jgi:sulfatase modifying factor 1